nr:unnamed protein product [Digitaria exilis]
MLRIVVLFYSNPRRCPREVASVCAGGQSQSLGGKGCRCGLRRKEEVESSAPAIAGRPVEAHREGKGKGMVSTEWIWITEGKTRKARSTDSWSGSGEGEGRTALWGYADDDAVAGVRVPPGTELRVQTPVTLWMRVEWSATGRGEWVTTMEVYQCPRVAKWDGMDDVDARRLRLLVQSEVLLGLWNGTRVAEVREEEKQWQVEQEGK